HTLQGGNRSRLRKRHWMRDAMATCVSGRGWPSRVNKSPSSFGRPSIVARIHRASARRMSLTPSVKLHTIGPGKPIENVFVASFDARLRDECLNETGSPICPRRVARSRVAYRLHRGPYSAPGTTNSRGTAWRAVAYWALPVYRPRVRERSHDPS